MARNQNTFEKQRREVEKKRKAADKRDRRLRRKEQANDPDRDVEPLASDDPPDVSPTETELP